MIQTLTEGVTTEVGILLLDASDAPVAGVLFGAVTITFRKNGAASFTTKSVLSGEWNEVGDGLYRLTFTSTELDTSGSFRYLVTGTGFERHENDAIIVDSFQSLATQIVDIRQTLATKVNIRDADILFSQLELRINDLEKRMEDAQNRLLRIESTIASLRTTL